MNKVYGVKFMLEYGHFYIAFMDRGSAQDLVNSWSRGGRPKDDCLSGTSPAIPGVSPGDTWCFKVSSIVGMHTIEAVVQPQANQQYVTTSLPTSGLYPNRAY